MSRYGTWRGIPREEIAWHPTVDKEKCVGCKECFNFCMHSVYGWDADGHRVFVKEPFSCVVGCSSCAGLCSAGAISFPPLTVLKEFLSERRQS